MEFSSGARIAIIMKIKGERSFVVIVTSSKDLALIDAEVLPVGSLGGLVNESDPAVLSDFCGTRKEIFELAKRLRQLEEISFVYVYDMETGSFFSDKRSPKHVIGWALDSVYELMRVRPIRYPVDWMKSNDRELAFRLN